MTRPAHAVDFTRGIVVGPAHWILGGNLPAYPDVRATRLAEVRADAWGHLADLPEVVASFTSYAGPAYAMLRNGVTHSWRGDEHAVEIIDDRRRLFFSELRPIGGVLFACGAGRQVFRKTGARWVPIDSGIWIDPAAGRESAWLATRTVLTSIDGFGEHDLFAVGTGGTVLHFDGQRWTETTSPTNAGLMRVRCFDRRAYACGFDGVLLRGGRDGWRVLSQQHGAPPLIDLAVFRGRLYAASEFGLHVLDGDTLIDVQHGIDGATGFGGLAAGESELLSIGGETILAFDGRSWRRVVCPWNVEE